MISNLDALAGKLEQAVREFTDVAVVGASGGVDSAVVAAVSVRALGAENVYLVSMPYNEVDRKTFNHRSSELAKVLKANHLVLGIAKPTDALVAELETVFEHQSLSPQQNLPPQLPHRPAINLHQLTSGNARARIRMTVLYGIAGELTYRYGASSSSPGAPISKNLRSTTEGRDGQEKISHPKRVRVMGTGNASEDLIGYDTKGGDALADLFVIGDLFKSEVYQLSRYYHVPQSIIEAVPSAGLYEGQTDELELGYAYDDLEPALKALHQALQHGVKDKDLSLSLSEFAGVEPKKGEFVIRRFLANAHKHRAPAVVAVRNSGFVN